MTMRCPRCRVTDDRWVRFMADVPVDGGGSVDLYRHWCREIMAVLTAKAAVGVH